MVRTRTLLDWIDAPDAPGTVADRIANALCEQIVDGRIPAGALLTEVEIATEHGASRTPAREAMLRLQAQGLVKLLPKKGALVTSPSSQERRDLLRVRGMLERSAVEYAVADHDRRDQLVADLRVLLAEQANHFDDPRAYAIADYTFHARIILDDGNVVIEDMLRAIAPRLLRLIHRATDVNARRLAEMHHEHAALLHAIEEGHAAGYAALVIDHLQRGHASYAVVD